MKILAWQKERCVEALAEYEWNKSIERRPASTSNEPVWTWANLPRSLKVIRLNAAYDHLEPLWPILEGEEHDRDQDPQG